MSSQRQASTGSARRQLIVEEIYEVTAVEPRVASSLRGAVMFERASLWFGVLVRAILVVFGVETGMFGNEAQLAVD